MSEVAYTVLIIGSSKVDPFIDRRWPHLGYNLVSNMRRLVVNDVTCLAGWGVETLKRG